MIDSIVMTRKGRIKHLKIVKSLVELVVGIEENVILAFEPTELEVEDVDEIRRCLHMLKSVIGDSLHDSETEKLQNGGPEFDVFRRNKQNERAEDRRRKFHADARELERIARSLWNPYAKDGIETEGLPVIVGQNIIDKMPRMDFKMQAAGDDTCADVEEEDDYE